MQIDITDKNNQSRVGTLEIVSVHSNLKEGDTLKIYSDDPRCSRLFFVVKPGDHTGIGILREGDFKQGDSLVIGAIRNESPQRKAGRRSSILKSWASPAHLAPRAGY